MPLTVADLDTLEQYLAGVMNRSVHHAETVGAIVLALLGAVLWKKDVDTPIEVRTYDGAPANVLWVQIAGQRYALAYNHREGRIELPSAATSLQALIKRPSLGSSASQSSGRLAARRIACSMRSSVNG